MKEFTYQIQDSQGIHARPAGQLVKLAQGFASGITIQRGEKQASLKKLFALMGMGVRQGETVTVTAEGPDESEATAVLEQFFRENL